MRTIQNYSRYSIDEKGTVINMSTGRKLSTFSAKGTESVTIVADDGRRQTKGVVGLLKVAYPELYEVRPPDNYIIHKEGDLSAAIPPENVSEEVRDLRKAFSYNQETGEIVKIATGHTGWVEATGYLCFDFKGATLKAHRLAFLLTLGYIPEGEIDHINHIRSDNRWDNLRVVSKQTNMRNLSKYTSNTSGVTGVSWHSKQNRWNARIMVNRKSINLGSFENKEDAIKARLEAAKKYNFHENHGEPK